jgi:hypothetical protein
MIVIVDKLLSTFGLMRIQQAKDINEEITACHERSLLQSVMDDYDAIPTPGFEERIRIWANQSFDSLLLAKDLKKRKVAMDTEVEKGFWHGYIITR